MAGARTFQLALFILWFSNFRTKRTRNYIEREIFEQCENKNTTVFSSRTFFTTSNGKVLFRLLNRKSSFTICKQKAAANYHDVHFRTFYLLQLLIIDGDVEANPGPIKYSCLSCSKAVRANKKGLLCDFCDV